MECCFCGHKPCVCHDTDDEAKNNGIECGKSGGNTDNPYSTNTTQYIAFKEGVLIGKKPFIDEALVQKRSE